MYDKPTSSTNERIYDDLKNIAFELRRWAAVLELYSSALEDNNNDERPVS